MTSKTTDGWPHCAIVPDHVGFFILAGFKGAKTPHISLTAQGIAKMITESLPLKECFIHRLFKSSEERLKGDTTPCKQCINSIYAAVLARARQPNVFPVLTRTCNGCSFFQNLRSFIPASNVGLLHLAHST